MSPAKHLTRRDLMKMSVATAAAALVRFPASAFGLPELQEGEQMIPFLGTPPSSGRPLLNWDNLTSWITPNDEFFAVQHYGQPDLDLSAWHLEIGGLVQNPTSLTLDEIRARPRQEYVRTLECSGNGASPRTNNGLIGNARWAGTRLAPILRECGLDARALEVVFFGADHGTEELRGAEYEQHFIRSLHVDRASQDDILLLYEMNGEPLPLNHGGPLRLGVPGWYGVAWVKWLSRIEIHDRRYVNRFMSRDYVTIRGEAQGEKVIWRQTLVGPMNLKSIVARVVRHPEGVLRVTGAAWGDGTPLRAVELKVDDGPWRRTQFTEGRDVPHTWTFWSYDWRDSQPGEHTLVSRAIDVTGRIQPSADDPSIVMKKTYWEANQQYPRRIAI